MRTVKWNAFLSGLCVTAVVLGLTVAGARADVTIERGASILAFPKVLADGGNDTVIQITNVSNSMVHARCFYVNAQLPFPDQPQCDPSAPFCVNVPLWQETDFNIWLTKQQPTHWRVSTGRFVNPLDNCFIGNQIDVESCENAGIDPGAIPPVPDNFIGELKCIEVDSSDNPIGGNHLKGEATVKSGGDVAKYNAIGIEGTELAGETGNTLLLNQPRDTTEAVGQYNACPTLLLVNHLAEGVTDPVILDNLRGGTCVETEQAGSGQGNGDIPCQSDDDCPGDGFCDNGPLVTVDNSRFQSLRSATINDLTLIPCSQDFENQIPSAAKIQFLVYNEFETVFSASTTITCWANFFLFQVDSPNDPERSVFSVGRLGSTAARTVIRPIASDGDPRSGVLGVTGVLRADRDGRIARTLLNLHQEGDRFTDLEEVDQIILPGF